MKTVSGRHSPLVRAFRTLADRPDARGERLLLDGVHLLEEARRAGARFDVVVVGLSQLDPETEAGRLARALERDGADVVAAPDRVFDAMSPVRTPSGIVAIVTREPVDAKTICARADAFVVAPSDVQDPGNLGALLRAAEAAGATGAIVCGASASPFSWKAVRGSMGSVLRLPVSAGLDTAEALDLLQGSGVAVVAAIAHGGRDPEAVDWRGPVALLLGGEGPGLPAPIVARADERVTIPMSPAVESLNVAVAAGILCYAARRQRLRGRTLPSDFC